MLVCPNGPFARDHWHRAYHHLPEGPINRTASHLEAFDEGELSPGRPVGDMGAESVQRLAHYRSPTRATVDRYDGPQVTPLPTELLVQPKGQKDATPGPTSVEFLPQTWSNALGPRLKGAYQGHLIRPRFHR